MTCLPFVTPGYPAMIRRRTWTGQHALLESYCAAQGWSSLVIRDLGSGMNYRKKGLHQLLELILERRMRRLVITHKDRLLRFGAELVFTLCELRGIEVVVIHQGEQPSFEEELAQDVLEIITVFSARLYGSRSRKHRKLLGHPGRDRPWSGSGRSAFMKRAHRIALKPTPEQEILFGQHAGYARFGYNWAVGEFQAGLQVGEWLTERTLRPRWNRVKGMVAPWGTELSQNAAKYAIIDLGQAAEAWGEHRRRVKTGQRAGRRVGFPKFKRRKHEPGFRADNGPDTVRVDGKVVILPKIGRGRHGGGTAVPWFDTRGDGQPHGGDMVRLLLH